MHEDDSIKIQIALKYIVLHPPGFPRYPKGAPGSRNKETGRITPMLPFLPSAPFCLPCLSAIPPLGLSTSGMHASPPLPSPLPVRDVLYLHLLLRVPGLAKERATRRRRGPARDPVQLYGRFCLASRMRSGRHSACLGGGLVCVALCNSAEGTALTNVVNRVFGGFPQN